MKEEKKILGAGRSLTRESAWTHEDRFQLRDESSVVWRWLCPSLPICTMGTPESVYPLEEGKVSGWWRCDLTSWLCYKLAVWQWDNLLSFECPFPIKEVPTTPWLSIIQNLKRKTQKCRWDLNASLRKLEIKMHLNSHLRFRPFGGTYWTPGMGQNKGYSQEQNETGSLPCLSS